MRQNARRFALYTGFALGASWLCSGEAAATDVKGSVRSAETLKETSVHAVRPPYWQEWNGFIEPKKVAVDYARDVSVVLIGAETMKDAVIVQLADGTLTPSTIVAQHNAPLRIRNQDDFTHKLSVAKLKEFDAIETSSGQSREIQLLQTGDFVVSDALAPYVHGFLHVLPKVTAIVNPQADGTFAFKDVHPGTYTLKVFRGAYEVSSMELEIKDGREFSVESISIDAKAAK